MGPLPYESRVVAGRSIQRADWIESGCLRGSVVADRSRYLGPRRVAQNTNVPAVIVAVSIGSLNVTVTLAFGRTLVAPESGAHGGDGGRCRVRGHAPPPTHRRIHVRRDLRL